jgi:predicted lipid-binding transport protein (Tim44 family)
MMGGGFQFLDLIFFAVVAVFLVMRLRSVLGRRTGTEQRRDPFAGVPTAEPPSLRKPAAPLPDLANKPVLDATAESPVAAGLARIREVDSSFDQEQFLAGARGAFEMIVNAYAVGDAAKLRPLLSDEVFANFNTAIEERRKAGQSHSTTLIGIRSLDIVEAELQGRTALVTVKIVSDQINVTRDGEGRVVDGNPTAAVTITDLWTFSRNTRSRDPNWQLVATRSPH